MRLRSALSALSTLVACTTLAGVALADRVAVLGFPPGDPRAQSATEAAVLARKHVAPAPAELAKGAAAVRDGQADTSDEYRAFGRAAGAAWTVRGVATPRAAGYRLELEVCQIDSGRVELLARDVDETQEIAQIGEMLALLLRPEGIASARLPWEGGAPKPAVVPAAPPVSPVSPEPPPAPTPPAVAHAYAEGHPLGLGASLGLLSALARPAGATGSATSLYLGGIVTYHLESVPGLELRANLAGAIAGPKALAVDVGARYAVPLLPSARLFLLPDLGLGSFVTLGAQKDGRFLVRGGLHGALGLGERVALELGPELGVTPGGSGTLVLFGATARAVARF